MGILCLVSVTSPNNSQVAAVDTALQDRDSFLRDVCEHLLQAQVQALL